MMSRVTDREGGGILQRRKSFVNVFWTQRSLYLLSGAAA
jgi:hypothetical protein